MYKKAIMLSICIVCVIFLASPPVFALGIELGGGYWRQDSSGDISYKPVSSVDTLDINSDLNFGREDRLSGRIKAELPLFLPDIYLMATPMKFEETGSKTVNFRFGDTMFDVAFPFDTVLKFDIYDVCLFYPVPLLKTATLKVLNAEIGLNARIIDFRAEVSGREAVTGERITESESKVVPVPMIYAGLQLNPVDFLSMEAEARGIAYSSSHYYDLIGRVKVKPLGPIFIAGGYRYNDIKIDYNDIEASVIFKGPFIEAGLFF